MPMQVEDYLGLGLDQMAPASCNERSNGDGRVSLNCPEDLRYTPSPESQGTSLPSQVSSVSDYVSIIYPETRRKVWCYSPNRLTEGEANRLIVFNDGGAYLNAEGPVAAAAVLDTLHQQGAMINTYAVFVQPGQTDRMLTASPLASYTPAEVQRSWEYDRLTGDYGRFLLTEILPLAEDRMQVRFSRNPSDRLLCGISSGGIAAFTAAWMYPQAFGNVLSHCGSFTNIWGGHHYPYLVRTTPRKPLRIFLQSGARDVETLFGDWATANQAMAKALAFAGYEHKFVFGEGGHTLRHGGSVFAESLRWFWPAQA